jgi:signal transduction histidine kinase
MRFNSLLSPSLCQAFACVPSELGFSSAGFRVIVHGWERELKAELRDEVFLIGREAIVNACRHSRATDIEMEVAYWPTELRIVVRDNGCGIDPRQLWWGGNEHGGLRGMRERAEKIGARLRLRSRARAGTEVELFFPNHIAFQLRSSQRPLGWLAGIGLRRRPCAIQ